MLTAHHKAAKWNTAVMNLNCQFRCNKTFAANVSANF